MKFYFWSMLRYIDFRVLFVYNWIIVSLTNTKEAEIMEALKVSSKSKPTAVAGALAGVLRENGKAEIQSIGAGAVNQAVKAVAIARGYVAPSGMDLVCIPSFVDIEIDGEMRTAIKFIVEPRK
jgi:stage V sporulation protein S